MEWAWIINQLLRNIEDKASRNGGFVGFGDAPNMLAFWQLSAVILLEFSIKIRKLRMYFMHWKRTKGINIEIDKLTNSIENTTTGEIFNTEITRILTQTKSEIKTKEWIFDWASEVNDETKEVYKLTTVNNPKIIQGLVSIETKSDHVFMHLIENASFNKGKNKIYYGVPANLVAFACYKSREFGFDGFLAFDAKTSLVKHYEEILGAKRFKGQRMIIDSVAANKLILRYFKNIGQ